MKKGIKFQPEKRKEREPWGAYDIIVIPGAILLMLAMFANVFLTGAKL